MTHLEVFTTVTTRSPNLRSGQEQEVLQLRPNHTFYKGDIKIKIRLLLFSDKIKWRQFYLNQVPRIKVSNLSTVCRSGAFFRLNMKELAIFLSQKIINALKVESNLHNNMFRHCQTCSMPVAGCVYAIW